MISSFIQLRNPILNKLMTEVTKSSNVTNLMLWDVKSRLFIIKDDVPIDDNKFSIFLDYLKMYYLMLNFYSSKMEPDEHNRENYESQISTIDNDDDQESIYVKQFCENFCFLVNMNENFRDNKIYLDFNLEKLREYIFKCIDMQEALDEKI